MVRIVKWCISRDHIFEVVKSLHYTPDPKYDIAVHSMRPTLNNTPFRREDLLDDPNAEEIWPIQNFASSRLNRVFNSRKAKLITLSEANRP
jgi:hypothetical protein